MKTPLAYFLTWTTHGTWLPGDSRGSVDPDHNAFATPFLPPSTARRQANAQLMRLAPVVLASAERAVVERAIHDHCRVRQWTLHALNVRTNHVHCVVGDVGLRPEVAMGQLKAWATRRLRDAGLVFASRVWTREGSTRYLFEAASVERAVAYVLHGQDSHA